MGPSFMSIVDRCDNFRLETATENYAEFRLSFDSKHAIGLIPDNVLAALHDDNGAAADSVSRGSVWDIRPATGSSRALVTFNASIDTPEKRTHALKTLTERWRDSGQFSDVISPGLWRNELYPVYIDAFGPRTEEHLAFVLERTACALFGLVTYGIHMTMYTEDGKIWVPTRAKTKQTWPLYLDNSVAGGIPYGMTSFEALVKECNEEASLEDALVRAYAKPCGAVSYFYRTIKGYLQPEVQFVYDFLIPKGQEKYFKPRPSDGEVQSFNLESLDGIIQKMHEGLFKPNCALVLVDFMIRHGHIIPENEPNYLDITTRLHGRFGYEL
ncbi:NUDIX hydrolase domain-like protein [Hysterangium stoloniferum]|nr:NUDIX hydrolase domain-like protein [Hysterangium stoloniferum]